MLICVSVRLGLRLLNVYMDFEWNTRNAVIYISYRVRNLFLELPADQTYLTDLFVSVQILTMIATAAQKKTVTLANSALPVRLHLAVYKNVFLFLVDDSVQKVKIITHTFPRYFALISRFRHETATIGPEGGMLTSKALPDVRAIFPPGSIKRSSKVQLQVH